MPVAFSFSQFYLSKAVFINIVHSPRFILSPESSFCTQSIFYTQSAVRSPQSAVRSPQSAVRSPQSVFYTDLLVCCATSIGENGQRCSNQRWRMKQWMRKKGKKVVLPGFLQTIIQEKDLLELSHSWGRSRIRLQVFFQLNSEGNYLKSRYVYKHVRVYCQVHVSIT